MKFAYPSILALILAGLGRGADAPPPPGRFSRDILPIFSENCFQCHGPDEKARKAKLRLFRQDTPMAVIAPAKTAATKLFRRIYANPDARRSQPPEHTLQIRLRRLLIL